MVPRIMDNHWSRGITIRQQPYCTPLTTVTGSHISPASGHPHITQSMFSKFAQNTPMTSSWGLAISWLLWVQTLIHYLYIFVCQFYDKWKYWLVVDYAITTHDWTHIRHPKLALQLSQGFGPFLLVQIMIRVLPLALLHCKNHRVIYSTLYIKSTYLLFSFVIYAPM